MSEPRDISWKRLSAEVAAIVFSILLAFWIDAWWDERKELLEEREILVGLQVEFVDLRDRLDNWAQVNRTGMQFVDRFLSDAVAEMDLRAIETAFAYAFFVNVLDQGGALDALLASGRLERISDRDIRARLSKWPDWLEDIHTNDLSIRNFAQTTLGPFLAKYGFPRTTCAEPELLMVCAEAGPVPPEYLQLAGNLEFRALLITRRALMRSTAIDHENALHEADQILAMLKDRLAELDN